MAQRVADRRRPSGGQQRAASRPRRRPINKKVYGCTVPRVWTPPLRELCPDVLDAFGHIVEPATSLGFDVIDWARESLHIDLLPWQEWLLVHALELLPDGTPRFKRVILLAGRQNGKSLVEEVLALYSMFVLGRENVLICAQDLDTAEAVWEHAVDLADGADEETGIPRRPELAELVARVDLRNGRKSLILRSGEQFKVKAATRRSARGLRGDLVFLDELREQQTWDAWAAITKTTQAKPLAQVWGLSNAGDVTSVVLRSLRLQGHRAVGDPDGIVERALQAGDDVKESSSTLGLFEWSAPPGCEKYDEAAWAQANPSLNYVRDDTSITSASLRASADSDPEWVFRTENLCQWPDTALAGLFAVNAWTSTRTTPLTLPSGQLRVRTADRIGHGWIGLDTSQDGLWTYAALCGRRADGVLGGEIAAIDRGHDWVLPWLLKHRDKIIAVTGQISGAPVSPLIKQLAKAHGIRLVPRDTDALFVGDRLLIDAINATALRHQPQETLDAAATSAVARDTPAGRTIDRLRSPIDTAPLIALSGAHWLATRPVAPSRTPAEPAALPPTRLPALLQLQPSTEV